MPFLPRHHADVFPMIRDAVFALFSAPHRPMSTVPMTSGMQGGLFFVWACPIAITCTRPWVLYGRDAASPFRYHPTHAPIARSTFATSFSHHRRPHPFDLLRNPLSPRHPPTHRPPPSSTRLRKVFLLLPLFFFLFLSQGSEGVSRVLLVGPKKRTMCVTTKR